MKLIKNKVGRPSNKTLRIRKALKITLVVLVATLVGSVAYAAFVLANTTINSLSASVIKPTNYQKVITRNDMIYYSKGYTGQALQGASIADGQIYYTTAVASSKERSDYYSKIRMLGKYNETAIAHFSPVISKTRKLKDIATSEINRNYYIAYSYSGENSYIYYSTGGIPRYFELTTTEGNRSLNNIAYNSENDTFYSLGGGKKANKVYAYKIKDATNKANKQDTVYAEKICKLYKNPAHTLDENSVSLRATTIKDGRLYVAYIVHPDGDAKQIRNYIAVYDLKNCTNDNNVYPEFTVKVGSCNTATAKNNCSLQSIFFMNNNLVLGYNNNKYNTSYFYTLYVQKDGNMEAPKTAEPQQPAANEEYKNWSQLDSRWKGISLGGSKYKMGDSGCLVTAVAILIKKSGVQTTIEQSGEEFNPGTFVRALNRVGGIYSNGNFAWTQEKIAPGFVYEKRKYVTDYKQADKIKVLNGLLNEGCYVVAQTKSARGRGHYVAIDTIKDGKVIMMDPASSATNFYSKYASKDNSAFICLKVKK